MSTREGAITSNNHGIQETKERYKFDNVHVCSQRSSPGRAFGNDCANLSRNGNGFWLGFGFMVNDNLSIRIHAFNTHLMNQLSHHSNGVGQSMSNSATTISFPTSTTTSLGCISLRIGCPRAYYVRTVLSGFGTLKCGVHADNAMVCSLGHSSHSAYVSHSSMSSPLVPKR